MRLIILGAGGYGRVIADIAAQSGEYAPIFFLDDNSQAAEVVGVCADISAWNDGETAFYPAFGNNEFRLQQLNRLKSAGSRIATIVHPTAYISPKAKLAQGTAVLPMAVVNTECEVAEGCIINCGAIVDHGCVLEAGVHVSPGAIVKAENRIPSCAKIESGEVVPNRKYPV